MDDLFNTFFVSGDFGASFFRLIILVIMFDCLIGVARAIGTIKESVS